MIDKTPKPFNEVPLKIAMIGWTPSHSKLNFLTPGRIIVMPHPDERSTFRTFGLSDSTGACWSQWRTMSTQQRLLKLYIEAWHIVCRDGLHTKDVHEALSVIPEYRRSLSGESFFKRFQTHV